MEVADSEHDPHETSSSSLHSVRRWSRCCKCTTFFGIVFAIALSAVCICLAFRGEQGDTDEIPRREDERGQSDVTDDDGHASSATGDGQQATAIDVELPDDQSESMERSRTGTRTEIPQVHDGADLSNQAVEVHSLPWPLTSWVPWVAVLVVMVIVAVAGTVILRRHAPKKKVSSKGKKKLCLGVELGKMIGLLVPTAVVGLLALAATLARLPFPWPYADRLAVIPPTDSAIDNVGPYDSPDKWATDGSLAALHVLNPTRVEYFDKRIRAALKPPFSVVDLGCGGGLVSNALATLPGYERIEGVDLSAPALEFARGVASELPGESAAVSFTQGDIYELPFAAGAFDVVVMSDILEHLLDVRTAVAEAYRVLRPGGILLFDTIDRSAAGYVCAILGAEHMTGIIAKGTHEWGLFIRPHELKAALDGVGFGDFEYQSFEPSARALAEMTAFSYGVRRADQITGGFTIGSPSLMMSNYIGYAVKPAAAQ